MSVAALLLLPCSHAFVLSGTSRFAAEDARRKALSRAAVVVSESDQISPYASLLSVTAAGDVAALSAASAFISQDHVLACALPLVLSWAALAPPLGAFAKSHTLMDAAKTPAVALAVAMPCGCALRGVLQGESLTALLVELLAASVLVEGWRASLYAVQKADRAMNAFALAVVDEDEGDDDF